MYAIASSFVDYLADDIQFTAPDLSSIAQNLDSLEDSYRDEGAAESRNMDDTGGRLCSESAQDLLTNERSIRLLLSTGARTGFICVGPQVRTNRNLDS